MIENKYDFLIPKELIELMHNTRLLIKNPVFGMQQFSLNSANLKHFLCRSIFMTRDK